MFERAPLSQRALTTTATTQPRWLPLWISCQARPSTVTGAPITATAVPSRKVVMTEAEVDGPVRILAPRPSVATMTCVGAGDGDASATTPGDGDAPGEAPGEIEPAGASVGGGPLSVTASAVARAASPTGAPSSGRSIRCGPHPTVTTMATATSTTARILKTVLRALKVG